MDNLTVAGAGDTMDRNLSAEPQTEPPTAALEPPSPRQQLFEALFTAFKNSLKENWERAQVESHPLGKRLIRLVRATYEQRGLYPEAWRVQFVRQARTLHSFTGYRDIRFLLFEWLRSRQFVPPDADMFVYADARMRRHIKRLSQALQNSVALTIPPLASAQQSGMTILTVDNPETADRDDALSLRPLNGGYEIGVHTPLLEHAVARNSAWDAWAYDMAVSIYMPHLVIPMLPHEVATKYASLDAGKIRPVLSFYFFTDGKSLPQFQRVCCEEIKIQRNASYEQIAQWLAASQLAEKMAGKWKVKDTQKVRDAELHTAVQVWIAAAQQFERKRLQAGGRKFDREQIDVRVGQDGAVQLRRYSQDSAEHKMVSEWMIAANHAAARFCAEQQLPCIYRVQETGGARENEEGSENANNFVRPQSSLEMAPHRDLGIDGYTQITSPLRRYTDLLVQRQIVAFLRNEAPVYSPQELVKRVAVIEETARRIHKIEARAEFYYKCVYLKQHRGETFNAEISYSPPPSRNVVLMLKDLGLRLFLPLASIKGMNAKQIPPADSPLNVRALCHNMDPERGTSIFQIKRAFEQSERRRE
ncbi:RNB domain-containing ribonuclease [candidate division KSB1 bacterium]|nr:RNB domain-containing ribonuclease [candidate division KSB1 bacterium]